VELAGAQFNESAPKKLMADDGSTEEKMKRDSVRPPSGRQEKQTEPHKPYPAVRQTNEFA